MSFLLDLFLTFAKVGLFIFGGGYKQKGFAGALIATIGMILPSFCIIFAISKFLDHFPEITWIAHAFQGIKIAVGITLVPLLSGLFG